MEHDYAVRVVGASVKAGALFLAVVEDTDDPALLGRQVGGCTPRILPNAGLDMTGRIGDLYDRVTQELRASSPDFLTILGTRKNNQWLYGHAVDRISIISTIHLASHHLQIPCREIKTEPVGRIVGQPANKLEGTPWWKFGYVSQPSYWTAGLAEAHAVAAQPLTEVWTEE